MTVLINAANLHGGGAVAVATSFIHYIYNNNLFDDIEILVSTEVLNNLYSLDIKIHLFKKVIHIDFNGLSSIIIARKIDFQKYSLVFTIFGPCYFKIPKRVLHIIGFAHPWIIYPNNLAYNQLKLHIKIFTRVINNIKVNFFKADILIVELEHVANALGKIEILKNIPVRVINSQVDPLYLNKELWKPLNIIHSNNLKLGIISKNYPHKNLKILLDVKNILKDKYELNADFYVTLSDNEFNRMDKSYRENIINVGELFLNQCPSFYNSMDGIIFPSLLECFSAVPIEAMYMKKPLFASNLDFIHDCCKEHAIYIDPINAANIAMHIVNYFNENMDFRKNKIENAFAYVAKYTKPSSRGDNYIKCINDLLIEKGRI